MSDKRLLLNSMNSQLAFSTAAGVIFAVLVIGCRGAEPPAGSLELEIKKAAMLAQSKANGDDARFTQAFCALANAAKHGHLGGIAPSETQQDAFKTQTFGTDLESFPDSVWRLGDAAAAGSLRQMVSDFYANVWEGTPTPLGEFEDCVAIAASTNSPGDFCCSGVLLSPNLVATAAHCPISCLNFVLFGNSAKSPTAVAVVRARNRHGKYSPATSTNDITLLFLQGEFAGYRPVARGLQVDAAYSLRIAGFGRTNANPNSHGTRCQGSVPIISGTCLDNPVSKTFRCNPGTEIVAKGLVITNDTCFRDSGGPAYVGTTNAWFVAALASRVIAGVPTDSCGYGSIYVRLEPYLQWIQAWANEVGAIPPNF